MIIFESSGKYLSMEAKFVEYYNNKKLYQGIQNQVPNTIYTLQNQIKNNCKIIYFKKIYNKGQIRKLPKEKYKSFIREFINEGKR